MLAELDADDAVTVLGQLARAGVGGYAATHRGARIPARRVALLYVDSMRYHLAEQVLMTFLRGRREPL